MGSLDRANHRFMELEGLRGIAAIVVVVFHSLLVFYPGMLYGVSAYGNVYQPNMPYESVWYGNPLGGVLSGPLAVSIFFVLSGFVLTIGFFQKRNIDIIKRLAAKRYIRLMLPALASIMAAYLLMKLGFSANIAKTAATTHSLWLGNLWLHTPHMFEALRQGLYGMFIQMGASYNPVLWTIYYEMIGSFIVFAAAALFGGSKHRWVLYGIMILLLWNTWIFGFVIGMVMADLYAAKREYIEKTYQWVFWLALVVGVVIGGYPANETTGTIYSSLAILKLSVTQNSQMIYTTIGAALIVMSVIFVPRLSRFFSHKYISILGKYTYSLYLVHMPLLLTVCTGLFISFHTYMGFHRASLFAVIVYLTVVAVATYLFERFIDKPATTMSGVIADVYFEKRSIPGGAQMKRIAKLAWRNIRYVRRLYSKAPAPVPELESELG